MSYSPVTPAGQALHPAANLAAPEQIAYIQKIYGFFFTGVLMFSAAAALPTFGFVTGIPGLQKFAILLVSVPWWLSIIVLLSGSFVAHQVSMVKGLNLLVFYGLAALFGLFVVEMISWSFPKDLTTGFIVLLQAIVLAICAFLELCLYTLWMKNFKFINGFLPCSLTIILVAVIVAIITQNMGYGGSFMILQLAISVILTILFVAYILRETLGVLRHYSADMIVPAGVGLLIDAIIPFRQNFLSLLSKLR